MDTTPEPPLKVLFIAGTGRSGTTILSSILGQVPGCFAAGEVRYTWERGLLLNHRCGCGEPFADCPVWTSVMATAFGGQRPDAAAVARSIETRVRVRQVPMMLLRRLTGRKAVPSEAHDATVLRLYRALSRQQGVEVIVDSSKLPPYGLLLGSMPSVQLYVVHVVRDPRATAFSWRRQKSTRDPANAATMNQLENWRSGFLWLLWNVLADRWWPRGQGRNLVVRYEDLMDDPAAVVERILGMIGLGLPPGLVRQHSVILSPTHSVAGNPGRHDTGEVPLRVDAEWQQAMPAAQRVLVTVLTLPGLRRFGYPVGTGSSAGSR